MGSIGGLLGGGKQTTKTPATGFYNLPKELQNIYTDVLGQTGGVVLPNGQLPIDAFTPDPLTAGEQSGLDRMTAGFTPTAESMQSDISMLMNPFDEYVINGINSEAQGQNSLTRQAGNQAGQIGSNRNFLATSDVEQNRLNSIGGFKQSQYNNAVNQILNSLVPNRRSDATGALQAGSYTRDLNTQTKQAPLNALNGVTGALGQFAQGFDGQKAQSVTTGGGIGGAMNMIGNGIGLAQGIGSLASFFSDRNLKDNIELIGEENGFPIYEFNYKGDDKKYIGVMAQDVQKIMPEAVQKIDGHLAVDYGKIGVKMRAV